MARKKYEEEHDNHERWLVSYADFITLLFAFFVVMYALSSVNEGKYHILSESLLHAFGTVPVTPISSEGGQVSAPLKALNIPQRAHATLKREKEYLTRIARDIRTLMEPLVEEGKVRVTQTDRGVTVEINASVLFSSGSAKLTTESSEALRAVAQVLKDGNRAIQVEGHTDSIPINNALFPSNWELSAVRASSVIRLFVESGIPEVRLTAVGRGSTKPVESNETAEGRLRNRRVTVMIMSRVPEAVTEVPVE